MEVATLLNSMPTEVGSCASRSGLECASEFCSLRFFVANRTVKTVALSFHGTDVSDRDYLFVRVGLSQLPSLVSSYIYTNRSDRLMTPDQYIL